MRVLYIEPFCGGSHATFTRLLCEGLERDHGVECSVLSMPGRHWKWRMRGAVPWLAERHRAELSAEYDLLFAGSFLALAELVGLFPRLGAIPRVLYFHENQVAYPNRDEFTGERDLHFSFTQLTSAMAASRCVFNSEYNRESFLTGGDRLFASMPDAKPTGWRALVEARSEVIGLPMDLPAIDAGQLGDLAGDDPARALGPILLWNHRWEHDKDPAAFFAALIDLAADGLPFRLIVCGEQFREIPEAMQRAREVLSERILHWGFAASREVYLDLMLRAQLVVSTAIHEFFGIAVLEATFCGARPLVPDRLSYPELFSSEYRYQELRPTLSRLCRSWADGHCDLRADRRDTVERFEAKRMVERYHECFVELTTGGPSRRAVDRLAAP